MTAAEHRAAGGTYPRTTGREWTSYREWLGEPLGPDEALPEKVVRFPSPAALRDMLRRDAPFALHAPGFDAAFVADPERIWDHPGARAFGAVALLDPWGLSPIGSTIEGAWLVDARQEVPRERAVYVPDPECCRAIGDAATWDEARGRLPADWRDRLDGALARIDGYIARVRALAPALDRALAMPPDEAAALIAEHGLERADLARPVFLAPPGVAARLDALARHLAGGGAPF